MTSNSSQRYTPIGPQTPTGFASLDDTARHNRGLRSIPQPPEPPKTGLSIRELIHHPGTISSVLTLAQHEKLRSIPAPQHLQHQPDRSSQLMSRTRESTISDGGDNSRRRKRKISEVDSDDEDNANGRYPFPKNTAHNRAEKLYRSNLNYKIAELCKSVPSLRMLEESARSEYAVGSREDLQGSTRARKLSKATVIATATEYIHQLEEKNARLAEVKAATQVRIVAFEKLYMSSLLDNNPTAGRYGAQCGIYQPHDTNLSHTDTYMTEVQGDKDGRTVLEGDPV